MKKEKKKTVKIIVSIEIEVVDSEFDGLEEIENNLSFPSDTWERIKDITYNIEAKK